MDMPEPPAAAPRTFTHAEIKRVVIGIMLCILLAALDQTVVIPAVPAIAGDLQAFGHLSWIVTAYLLTSTAATPLYGKLSDIYGRRALLLPALVLFIVASMLCGYATTLPQLIGARALQGLGGAGLMAMAQAAVADVVAPRERGRYQGYMASMWGIASIGGPIVGGYVTDHLSWRWLFWANLPIGLVAFYLCNRALRTIPVVRRPARIDWTGAALLVGSVTACLLTLSWGGSEYAWASAPILGLIAVAVASLGALVWWERRAADPVLPPRLFADAVFFRGVMVAFVSSLGLFGVTFLLPLYFQLILGVDASSSGLLVMPFMAANVAGAYTSGQVARRIGRTRIILVCALSLATVGLTGLVILGPLWFMLLSSIVLGCGIGATMPTVLITVQNAAASRDVGAATGSLLFLRSMGGAFGSTVVGTILTLKFNAGLVAMGLAAVDLGSLRGEGGPGLSLSQARAALMPGFMVAFGLCAALMAVAILIARGMKDQPLRSGLTPTPPAH